MNFCLVEKKNEKVINVIMCEFIGLPLLHKIIFVGEQNLGPCGGLRYNVSSTIRPRRGNHRETS